MIKLQKLDKEQFLLKEDNMKPNMALIITFLFVNFIPLGTFAQQSPQQGPRILSNNIFLRILEAGKSYSMAEFTPQLPLKIEVKGPGKLTVYIKTAISQKYSGLPAFKLFIKRDSYITNQYAFPKTTRSTFSFEGIKGYNPSAEVYSIPIDVPEGVHTYEIYLSQSPYIIGLASFGYTQLAVRHISMARPKGTNSIARNGPDGQGHEKGQGKTVYITPYIMAGAVYEQDTSGDSVYGGIGANADVFINKYLVVSGMIDYSDAAQRYLSLSNPSLPPGTNAYIVNEQILLIHALLSYAFLHTDRNILMLGAGWGDLEMINDLLPGDKNGFVVSALFKAASQSAPLQQSVYNINGPVVSALIKFGLSERTNLSIRPSYMQDVWNVSANTNSILGTPYSLLLYPVGLAFNLSPGVSVEIGYDGRLLTFQDTNMFYNGGFIAVVF